MTDEWYDLPGADPETDVLFDAGWDRVPCKGGGEMWRCPVTQHTHTRDEALWMVREEGRP